MHQAILLLKKIPKGKVTTYKELARVLKTSPRAVGRVMANNKYPKEYSCYKVVSSTGELTGYSGPGGLAGKEKLLRRDGIVLEKGKVPFEYFFTFSS